MEDTNSKIQSSIFGHGNENEFMQSMNEVYLPEGEYWYYAFHPIVIYAGGITASSLIQVGFFMNKKWILLVEFSKDTGTVVGRVRLDNISLQEVNTKGFMAKLQKRQYLIQLNDVEVVASDKDEHSEETWSSKTAIQIISLKSPQKQVQDEQATRDLLADIQKVSQGEALIKPWH